ncbi:MAG: O-acetylhomoserine aminocarboxypropyltransferase/cysteine synthase [Rhodocyclales bacterium]|nr:O-acetylhomoserine aminocarboxypropyltransferase/cysteine synthase [Rhodocyclales bacterium]
MDKAWRFETSVLHAGYEPDEHSRSVAVPINLTAAFAFDSTEHSVELFDGKVAGHIYTRIANPTLQVLEQRIACLESGVGATVTASGQAAVTAAVLTIAGGGDNIVAASSLYGTTFNLFAHTLAQYGVETRFAPYNEPEFFAKLIDHRTKAFFCESIANPAGHVPDISSLANIAHENHIPLIVDNTVATPYLCRPIEHGADIIVHSLTKYISGHGIVLGGAVIDAGRFRWADYPERFEKLSLPDEAHHRISFTDRFGDRAYIARCASVPLRSLGAVLSPLNAFFILQGIETLPLRMDRICFNAEIICQFLEQHTAVSWVSYAASPAHPDHSRVKKYMRGKGSGVLSFGIRGGKEAGSRFHDAVKLIRRSVNIGDCKSLVCHPASTTHRQLSKEELIASGVTEDLVRLSIGTEHIQDLLSDIDQALVASQT